MFVFVVVTVLLTLIGTSLIHPKKSNCFSCTVFKDNSLASQQKKFCKKIKTEEEIEKYLIDLILNKKCDGILLSITDY